MVTYRCPSNTAVQVYNYQHKTARVVFGPELVILDPHETFNVLFLSGKISLKSLAISFGGRIKNVEIQGLFFDQRNLAVQCSVFNLRIGNM